MSEAFKNLMKKEIIKLNEKRTDPCGYECPLCKNKGWIYEPIETKSGIDVVMKQCKCSMPRKLIGRIYGKSTVPYNDFNFELLKNQNKNATQNIESVEKFLDRSDKWLFLFGNDEKQKKLLSGLLAVGVFKKNKTICYTDWVTEAKKMKNRQFGNFRKRKAECCKADMLIINNLFDGKVSNNSYYFLSEVLNERYKLRKPTVILSRKNLSQLGGVSRYLSKQIFEMSEGFMIQVMK